MVRTAWVGGQTEQPNWRAMFRDGRWMFVHQKGVTALRDEESGKDVWRVTSDEETEDNCLSDDGSVWVTWQQYGSDGALILWDTATGKNHRLVIGEVGINIHGVSLSRDAKFVVYTTGRDQVEMRDTRTGALVQTFAAPGTGVGYVVIAPDASWVAAGGEEATIWMWDVASGREIRRFLDPFRPTYLRLSEDGRRMLIFAAAPILCDFERPARERAIAARVETARAVLERNPNDPAALGTLGEWYAFKYVDDWAIALMERARTGGGVFSALELARAYWRQGRLTDAVREFTRARDLHEAPAEYLDLCIAATSRKPAKR